MVTQTPSYFKPLAVVTRLHVDFSERLPVHGTPFEIQFVKHQVRIRLKLNYLHITIILTLNDFELFHASAPLPELNLVRNYNTIHYIYLPQSGLHHGVATVNWIFASLGNVDKLILFYLQF